MIELKNCLRQNVYMTNSVNNKIVIFYTKLNTQHKVPQIIKFSKPNLRSSPNFPKYQIIVIIKISSSKYSIFGYSFGIVPLNIKKTIFI